MKIKRRIAVSAPNPLRKYKGDLSSKRERTSIPEMKNNPDYTSIINQKHYERLNELIEDATSKGAKVTQGQTIGYVGSTGLATGPHLHYEFHIDGKHTDPVKVEPPNAQSINSYNKKYFDKLVKERSEIISNISNIQ